MRTKLRTFSQLLNIVSHGPMCCENVSSTSARWGEVATVKQFDLHEEGGASHLVSNQPSVHV
jgi:hypothetical protein